MAQNSTIREIWPKQWSYWIIALMLLSGLVLSIISYLDVCAEECKAGHDWSLFGLPFAPIGLLFFSLFFILHLCSLKYPILKDFVGWGLAGALGAEVVLIGVQKYLMLHWCPVCLAIATTVLIALLTYLYTVFKGDPMKKLSKSVVSLAMFALGFTTLYVGIAKVNPLEAIENSVKEKMVFGNPKSTVSVFLFTDWACPACRVLEGHLKPLMPTLLSDTKLTFVDLPVHPETLNFSPYNMAFMINHKKKYVELRDGLTKLSEETGTPKESQIEEIAKKEGVTLKELNYADVAMGLQYWKELAEHYNIEGTPMMVIVNESAKKGKKLSGSEITEENIKKAIETLK